MESLQYWRNSWWPFYSVFSLKRWVEARVRQVQAACGRVCWALGPPVLGAPWIDGGSRLLLLFHLDLLDFPWIGWDVGFQYSRD